MAKLSSCSSAVKPRRRPRAQVPYRVRNWPAYNAGLKQRGSLTVWVPPDLADVWYYQGPTKRGGPIYLFGRRHPNGADAADDLSFAPAPSRGLCRFGVGAAGA